MKRLTADYLVKHRACHEQVVLFRETFPKGAPLTAASLAKAEKAGLNWGWLVPKLTDPAMAEYLRITDPAMAEYRRIKATALAQYRRIKVTAWAEYLRIAGTAWAEYLRIEGTALLAALKLMED